MAAEPAEPAAPAVATGRPAPFPDRAVRAGDSLANLEKALGGRQALVDALLQLPPSPKTDQLIAMLADPDQDRESLLKLCYACEVAPGTLLRLYQKAELARGQLLAVRAVADALPRVAADVMRRATIYEETCAVCRGTTQVLPEATEDNPNPEPLDCLACGGYGFLVKQPDHEVQKTALQLGELLQKGGPGVQVQVAAHANAAAAALASNTGLGGALDQLTEAADQVLYGDARGRRVGRDYTEAEVVDAGSTASEADAPESAGNPDASVPPA